MCAFDYLSLFIHVVHAVPQNICTIMAAPFFIVNPPREEVRDRPRVLELEELTDDEVMDEYRLTRSQIKDLCDLLRSDLAPARDANRGRKRVNLSLEEKVLISLKTLASGSFQNSSKDNINVSQPTVSVVLDAFLKALFKKAGMFIRMPQSDSQQRRSMMDFYDVAGFPGVLGCIDCTHIPIRAPSLPEDEYAYVNRKGFHSINVQAVCNANMEFTNVTARWAGGHHDSHILGLSSVGQWFESGSVQDGWLLDDSGYGLKSWLMVPFANPTTSAQKKYNTYLKKTRVLIECAFGILKSRWRILDHTGGYLCYTPTKVAYITVACCVLHNICRRNGNPLPDDGLHEPVLIDMDNVFEGISSDLSGSQQRDRIVNTFV